MMFHITFEKAGGGWIVAGLPALPGCISQGMDENEASEYTKETVTAGPWAEGQKACANCKS